MAVPFGFGIGDFVFFITTAIEIGKRIIDAPKEILAIIKSLENLETYMVELKDLVESSATELKESTKTRLEQILRDIEVDVKDTEKILRAWEVKEGPRGIKLRLEPVHRAIWPFGSNPKRMKEIQANIERQQRKVALYIPFILRTMLKAKAHDIKVLVPKPSVDIPARRNYKTQYNNIFVDPYNEGRSVIAQAYTRLLRDWTIRTNGHWPLNWNQSAGHLVKMQSETVTIQERIGMKMVNGGEKALATPTACLFERSLFQGSYKDELWENTLEHASRGLKKNVFTDYDFILVFNKEHAEQFEAPREAFAAEDMVKAGMGKLKLLGAYGYTGTAEIWNPWTRNGKVSQARAAWDPVVWNIQTSVEAFLETECGWKKSPDGTKTERRH